MPSDKHNLTTARATDLISSLINIALFRDVPFHQVQKLKCLHHVDMIVPFCVSIVFSKMAGWIAETLFILFFAYIAV